MESGRFVDLQERFFVWLIETRPKERLKELGYLYGKCGGTDYGVEKALKGKCRRIS